MSTFRIYIGGVGGVGKTTIARELAHGHGMRYFSGSQIMVSLCGVSSKEELSIMSEEEKIAVRRFKYPSFVTRNQRVIIDGHCELLPEEAGCFDAFVFLTASAKIIGNRRKNKGDGRRSTDLKTILMEQKEYRRRSREIEQNCGIKFVVVSNAGSTTKTCELIEKGLGWK